MQTRKPESYSLGAMSPAGEVKQSLSLLVVIPCLNEEETVGRVVAGLPKTIAGVSKIDVLVMDDGSTDKTAERAREAGAEVHRHATNLGLGATFREAIGISLSRGVDLVAHIDGDGQFDPADIPKLVRPIVEQQAHMATASRFLDRRLIPKMPAIKKFGNWGVALIVRLLSGQQFRDVSCGFRAFSTEALLRMNLFGSFTYTQESFLDLIFKDLSILEIPVSVRGVREFGTSRIASSIPRYAARSMGIMMRAFISYRPFRFFLYTALLFLALALGLLGFLLSHYLESGSFSPHIWAGFIGGSFAFLGVSTLVTGFIGDILVRIRLNQENILFHLRRAEWEQARAHDDPKITPLLQ